MQYTDDSRWTEAKSAYLGLFEDLSPKIEFGVSETNRLTREMIHEMYLIETEYQE